MLVNVAPLLAFGAGLLTGAIIVAMLAFAIGGLRLRRAREAQHRLQLEQATLVGRMRTQEERDGEAAIALAELAGFHYSPLSTQWRIGGTVDVNYLAHYRAAAEDESA
jgi:hypothetical protein